MTTLRFLVSVDGSQAALAAVQHLIKLLDWYREPVEVHLLNVQMPILSGNVKTFINREQLEDYYRGEGVAALKAARACLDEAGVKYVHHIGVGEPAAVIMDYAQRIECDQIVIGARGRGSVADLLLGSVANKVIHLADRPVLLVK
jgi:nucleotide-binding universal stress UspA family protein